jgi:hypothetical protein
VPVVGIVAFDPGEFGGCDAVARPDADQDVVGCTARGLVALEDAGVDGSGVDPDRAQETAQTAVDGGKSQVLDGETDRSNGR